jgi:hypothetical protein
LPKSNKLIRWLRYQTNEYLFGYYKSTSKLKSFLEIKAFLVLNGPLSKVKKIYVNE